MSEPRKSSSDQSTKADQDEDVILPTPETSATTTNVPSESDEKVEERLVRADGKIELREDECEEVIGSSFSTTKKWIILSVIFVVQSSMNFNASVYANAITPLSEEFNVSKQVARIGQMIFLIAYGFGSEFWAPWSEEFGRWSVLQTSLFFVNIWQIPCALAPNFATIVVSRFLGGLSSAGGSVTLGMVADMWDPDSQQYAVAFIVLSSVGGSVLGPIAGGFIQQYLSWRWIFWTQLIFGGAVQAMHFFMVPETRLTALIDKEAKRRRKNGQENIYGPNELKEHRLEKKEVIAIWIRPFEMFVREPIVLWLSLLSGFSDALIFTFLEAFQPVLHQWGFGTVQIGLSFITILVGYFIAYFSFFPFIYRHQAIRAQHPDALQPEARLYWLLWVAPLETIGLFGFACKSIGPPEVHWIAPLIFACLIAIANYSIYMATIDYMIASYGPYSASATGGNALARDVLAGVAAMYSTPFYENIGNKYKLEWPTTILGVLAILVTLPIYVFYMKGPEIREKSKFAQILASDRLAKGMGKQNRAKLSSNERRRQENSVSDAEKGTSTGQNSNSQLMAPKNRGTSSNNASSLNSTEASGSKG